MHFLVSSSHFFSYTSMFGCFFICKINLVDCFRDKVGSHYFNYFFAGWVVTISDMEGYNLIILKGHHLSAGMRGFLSPICAAVDSSIV